MSKGRAKRGIFEGDLEEGELEIGQASALLNEKGIQTAAEVMDELVTGYQRACETLARQYLRAFGSVSPAFDLLLVLV